MIAENPLSPSPTEWQPMKAHLSVLSRKCFNDFYLFTNSFNSHICIRWIPLEDEASGGTDRLRNLSSVINIEMPEVGFKPAAWVLSLHSQRYTIYAPLNMATRFSSSTLRAPWKGQG